MKHTLQSTLFILLFSIISISVTAQNNTNKNTKDLLIGTWVFDLEASKPDMEVNAKIMIEKNLSAHNRLIKDYKGRQLTFTKEGHFLLHLADGRETQGIWEVYEVNGIDIVKLTSSQSHIQNLSILMISNQSLIVKQEHNGKGTPVFPKWYFLKN
jgi:hypothetical protein